MTGGIITGVLWIVFAVSAWRIGHQKGHPYAGLLLGCLLPYAGLAVIAWFPARRVRPIGRHAA